ncbi:hypothetical protein vBCbaSRXM_15 [Citromicrobium phage vB_CbaS-RXM]|nr:hypothetical protein vBCbaSRXM_15 [Citromicrobium phage vB_CbaS-RXM]
MSAPEWYAAGTGNHQGLVIDRATGANIAVCYDKAHAPMIAAAPTLLHAAKEFIAELDSSGDFANWERVKAQLREAVEGAEA